MSDTATLTAVDANAEAQLAAEKLEQLLRGTQTTDEMLRQCELPQDDLEADPLFIAAG